MQANFDTVTTGLRHVSQCYEATYYSTKPIDMWAKIALATVAVADLALSISDFRKIKEPLKWALFAARIAVILTLQRSSRPKGPSPELITQSEQRILLAKALLVWTVDMFGIKKLNTPRYLDAMTGVELACRVAFLRVARII